MDALSVFSCVRDTAFKLIYFHPKKPFTTESLFLSCKLCFFLMITASVCSKAWDGFMYSSVTKQCTRRQDCINVPQKWALF